MMEACSVLAVLGVLAGFGIGCAVLEPIISRYRKEAAIALTKHNIDVAALERMNAELRFQLEMARRPIQPVIYKSGLSPDMRKRLIFLCHPDKHNNSPASRAATEYLLAQRS